MQWMLAAGVAGVLSSIAWTLLWALSLRRSLAERGRKYTSIVVGLSPIPVLLGSVRVIMKELGVLQEGTVDTALSYVMAALAWIILYVVVGGILLDIWRTTRHSA